MMLDVVSGGGGEEERGCPREAVGHYKVNVRAIELLFKLRWARGEASKVCASHAKRRILPVRVWRRLGSLMVEISF